MENDIIHNSVIELLNYNNNSSLLDPLRSGEVVLLERVPFRQGMSEEEFDALAQTEAKKVILLREVDKTRSVNLEEKEKYIAMRASVWNNCKNKKQLTLDLFKLKGITGEV